MRRLLSRPHCALATVGRYSQGASSGLQGLMGYGVVRRAMAGHPVSFHHIAAPRPNRRQQVVDIGWALGWYVLMANPQLRNLLLARSATAMDLAYSFLSLADPEPSEDPADDVGPAFDHIRSQVHDAEAQQCALLQYAGMSWDTIATLGAKTVSCQSLHRRMARSVEDAWFIAELKSERNEEQLKRRIASSHDQATFLRDFALEDLDRAPQVWEDRRYTRYWWH